MRVTIFGWRGHAPVAIDVSAETYDRFIRLRAAMGLCQSKMIAIMLAHKPHRHVFNEAHVLWYLDIVEQGLATLSGYGAGVRGARP